MIRVRERYPKSSYLPIIPILRDFETGLRDIVNFLHNNDSSVPRGFDESVFLVDPKSSEMADLSTRRNNENVPPDAREPIVKVSPPTPLKKPPKNYAVTSAGGQRAYFPIQNKSTIKKADSYRESEFLDVLPKNSITPHDGSRDGRVYSKRTCPFHRHEPAVKIFDDDIERYLTEDPRASVSPGEKLNKLPRVRDASKYDKDKNRRTSAGSEKTKGVTVPRKGVECRAGDVIDLIASEIAKKIEFKDKKNKIDKQHDVISDVRMSELELSRGKGSTKVKEIANGPKIVSPFPESFQPQNRVRATSGKVMNKSRNSQAPEIRGKLINESE